jgi:hypothetical protein
MYLFSNRILIDIRGQMRGLVLNFIGQTLGILTLIYLSIMSSVVITCFDKGLI